MEEVRFERKHYKRSVIALKAADFDQSLEGAVDHARALMKLAPAEVFDAGPTDAAQKEIA